MSIDFTKQEHVNFFLTSSLKNYHACIAIM